MEKLIDDLIRTLNVEDVQGALSLFTPGAVIDDTSVGGSFIGAEGIKRYFERFFIGYKTTSRVLSIDSTDDRSAVVRLDFTGDFGHEVGILEVTIGTGGLIERIDADLE